MNSLAVKVLIRPTPPVKVVIKQPETVVVVVEKQVERPPVRVAVQGIQGAKGDKGEPGAVGPEAVVESVGLSEIDGIFGVYANAN